MTSLHTNDAAAPPFEKVNRKSCCQDMLLFLNFDYEIIKYVLGNEANTKLVWEANNLSISIPCR